jgi:hypothetical protein
LSRLDAVPWVVLPHVDSIRLLCERALGQLSSDCRHLRSQKASRLFAVKLPSEPRRSS